MKIIQPLALAAATLTALLGIAGPASAALTVTLSPADAAAQPGPATSFVFGLDVAGLEDLGIDISDAPVLAAFIRFVPMVGSASPAPLSIASASVGSYFDTLFNPVVSILPAGSETKVDVQYSTFDDVTFQTVPLPASGQFVSFTVAAVPFASPGTWNMEAYLVVDNEDELPVLSNVTSATITLVPEPETYALFAAGLLALGAAVRRRAS